MSEIRTCLACGHEGHEVAMRLVEIPKAEQRVVQVAIPVGETQRGVKGFEYADVREAWAHEPRCRDGKACAERLKALQPVAPAVEQPADVTEESGWVL